MIIHDKNKEKTAKENAVILSKNKSWKKDQRKILDLIIVRQDLNNSSSKGGTYNPRQAWQTIDRGRKTPYNLLHHTRNDDIDENKKGNWYMLIYMKTKCGFAVSLILSENTLSNVNRY